MPEPLPIDEVLPRLGEVLATSSTVVLQAPPGAGKTTRVPPLIASAPWARGGVVIMLEPRRMAARAAARRIASELAVPVGGEVGYQVRFDEKESRDTRILIVTEGIFLRRIQQDPFLEESRPSCLMSFTNGACSAMSPWEWSGVCSRPSAPISERS